MVDNTYSGDAAEKVMQVFAEVLKQGPKNTTFSLAAIKVFRKKLHEMVAIIAKESGMTNEEKREAHGRFNELFDAWAELAKGNLTKH